MRVASLWLLAAGAPHAVASPDPPPDPEEALPARRQLVDGSPDPSPDPSPSPEAAFAGCVDTDNGATDVDGYGCADYTGYYYYYAGYSYTSYSEDCNSRDDDDFSSLVMCCACGGVPRGVERRCSGSI